MVCLLLASFIGLPFARASIDVEARIVSAIEWIEGQKLSDSQLAGFGRGTSAPSNQTIFVEDQALVALALSDYHSTHNDGQYDGLLKIAADFIASARTSRGDFYEYYDTGSKRWHNSGYLYPWDAYAVAGLAAAASRVSSKDPQQLSYWTTLVAALKNSVNAFMYNRRSDGSWLFRDYRTGKAEALTRENAILLVALLYIGLFESQWGSKQQSAMYGQLAQKTAGWLFSLQDRNASHLTFGGFPQSDLNSTQVSEGNGEVLLGVDSYYSIIGVISSNPSPTIWDARAVMSNWVNGFVVEMRDQYGGPYYSRTSSSLATYPKTTRAAAWILQALDDIWINLGGNDYYANATLSYYWIIGENELGIDLQGATSISGSKGGFYTSITGAVVNKTSTVDVAASTLYAMIRSALVQIPEYPQGTGLLVLLVLTAVLAVSRQRKNECRV